VHAAGMLHRDVKPDNVMLTSRGAVLIDFGSARLIVAGGRQSVVITPGYAPLEQYATEAKRGPFTDVYALGATLFFAVTGQPPVTATDRASGASQPTARELNPKVSKRVSDAIERAMRMRVDERPQSAAAFLADLERAVSAATAPMPIPAPRTRPAPARAAAPSAPPPPRPAVPVPPPAPAPAGQPPAPVPVPARRGGLGDWLWVLWLAFGGLIVFGELRGVQPLLYTGLYGVALLMLYSVARWLVTARVGRALLLLVAFAAGYYYWFYLRG